MSDLFIRQYFKLDIKYLSFVIKSHDFNQIGVSHHFAPSHQIGTGLDLDFGSNRY